MASSKCRVCGLVNFSDATTCRRCKADLIAAVAAKVVGEAARRVVVGPVFTNAGFRSWHLVCLPDVLVAVPQGVLVGMLTSVAPPSGTTMPLRGVFSAILDWVFAQLSAGSKKAATNAEATLRQVGEERLRSDPRHVLYPVHELRSITFKQPMFSSPEIRIESASRGITVYGTTKAFPEVHKVLQSAYPICGPLAERAGFWGPMKDFSPRKKSMLIGIALCLLGLGFTGGEWFWLLSRHELYPKIALVSPFLAIWGLFYAMFATGAKERGNPLWATIAVLLGMALGVANWHTLCRTLCVTCDLFRDCM
jgi:hypothetical protein